MEEIEYNEILWMVDKIFDFYNNIDTIEDYFIEKKREKIIDLNIDNKIPLLFNDPNMSPMDMDIGIEIIDGGTFNPIVQSITSMPLESQLGRQLNVVVKENNTNTWLGFIRIASPIITIKPRSELLGFKPSPFQVNTYMINGCVIVPVQPFGYNYLGGKLMALVSSSHEVREIFNEKYQSKTDLLFWETTSLYGDIKGVSQYDGLKPFIRYQDLTESDTFLFPTDEIYHSIVKKLRQYYGKPEWDNCLVEPYKPKLGSNKSGPKMREFNKMISIIKNKLRENDMDMYNRFHQLTKNKMKAKTKKRFYYSNYGFENVIEVLKDKDVKPIKGINYYKHYLSYMIDWWKKKSVKRWEKLKNENRLKTELELYTNETINNEIKMIR